MVESRAKETDDTQAYENDFAEAINDDLNIPKALAILQDILTSSLSDPKKLVLMKKFDEVLGLNLDTPMQNPINEKMEVYKKLREYAQSRDNQQFDKSDALRKEIEALGFSVRDTEHGSYVVKKYF